MHAESLSEPTTHDDTSLYPHIGTSQLLSIPILVEKPEMWHPHVEHHLLVEPTHFPAKTMVHPHLQNHCQNQWSYCQRVIPILGVV
jgi:hypothetical protein